MTQDDLILSRLQEGRTITPAEAASEWGILALHSAVARLRKRGYLIECEIRAGCGRRWGEYRLIQVQSFIAEEALEGLSRMDLDAIAEKAEKSFA